MRTKTLLITAALGVASIATSMAQVYSVNAVGYVNVTVNKNPVGPVTYLLIANPLNTGGNTLAEVLPTVPDLTIFFLFDNNTHLFQSAATYLGGWDDPTRPFPPGAAGFIGYDNSSIAGPQTITFVGEVPQGTLTTPIPGSGVAGAPFLSFLASKVPQAGTLTAQLGFPPQDFDTVSTWDKAAWGYNSASTYLGGWDIEPTVGVAEGFILYREAAGGNWTRTFSVNN